MISTLITAIFALVFSVAFAFRNHFQFVERNNTARFDDETEATQKKANTLWHMWQGVVHLSVIAAIAAYSFWQPVWLDCFLFWTMFWLMFETTLNLLNGDGLVHVGGGFIDELFARVPYGAFIKLATQILLVALTVLLYNWFP